MNARSNKCSAKYVSTDQAAATIGVARKTVIAWVRSGWLKGKIGPGVRGRIWVASSSLAGAFMAKCIVCGKRFRAKHPQKAKFCSSNHRQSYFRQLRQSRR